MVYDQNVSNLIQWSGARNRSSLELGINRKSWNQGSGTKRFENTEVHCAGIKQQAH